MLNQNQQSLSTESRKNEVLDFKVIISNGLKNFHMSSAAAEADKRFILDKLFCGVYPSSWVLRFLPFLRILSKKAAQKLAGRRVEVQNEKIQMLVLADIIGDIGLYVKKLPWLEKFSLNLQALAMRVFSKGVRTYLKRKNSMHNIYHYRAGFGLSSLLAAKQQQNILLCDHSIAHPLLLDSLILNQGKLCQGLDRSQLDPIWSQVQADIDNADHILVNSEFVKETFKHLGYSEENISVIYQGVDDSFFNYIPERVSSKSKFTTFLFAGYLCERKGARYLLEAVKDIPKGNWVLNIAGNISTEFEADLKELEAAGVVKYLGSLSRDELAKAMVRADVFVFPTLAEGSARVIFEAMACGCYIITTANAGSVVEHMVNGAIIDPGSISSIVMAMKDALSSEEVSIIGERNVRIIKEKYMQSNYGKKLAELYNEIRFKFKERFSANE